MASQEWTPQRLATLSTQGKDQPPKKQTENNGSQTEKQLRQYNTAIFTILYKNHFEY
jgi:hypothetical protein